MEYPTYNEIVKKILPCFFCTSSHVQLVTYTASFGYEGQYITCITCHAQSPRILYREHNPETSQTLVSQWNEVSAKILKKNFD